MSNNEMGISDSTKPIYHDRDDEDIEEFLEDYEAYSASKDWDGDKITWADLKAAVISGAQASCDVEENCEKSYKGLEKRQWYVQGLREPFKERVEMQYSEIYEDAKKWAIKVEKYSKDNEYSVKSPTRSKNEEQNMTKSDVDDLTSAFEALKICRVGQSQDPDDRIAKMKSSIKELTKAILDLRENKKPIMRRNQTMQNQKPNSRNQPNRPQKDGDDEYLRVELKEGKSLFDVRNLEKRRRIEDKHEMLSWAQKSTYVD
ncbi:29354_t:CDS:2, partial [Racocetra persica]